MLAIPVLGRGARPGSIGNQCVGGLRLYPGETSRSISCCDMALHANAEGVVTTGVDNDETQALCAIDRFDNTVQRNRFVRSISLVCKLCVDRDHIIGSVKF